MPTPNEEGNQDTLTDVHRSDDRQAHCEQMRDISRRYPVGVVIPPIQNDVDPIVNIFLLCGADVSVGKDHEYRLAYLKNREHSLNGEFFYSPDRIIAVPKIIASHHKLARQSNRMGSGLVRCRHKRLYEVLAFNAILGKKKGKYKDKRATRAR
jgi:hypothetical protein